MATVTLVTDKHGTITIFASEELAKKSVEFSCHKLPGMITYGESEDGTIHADYMDGVNPPRLEATLENVHVFDRVTHL